MAYDTKKPKEKAYLIGITFSNKEDVKISLSELESLANTAYLDVVGSTFQYIRQVTPATLIGSGKLEEVKEDIAKLGATVVVVDHELSGSQARNLSEELDVKVIDRITLILDIFASRAISSEGKIQVELAQLKYNLPRLSSITGTSGRFGSSGVGMRGPGETQLEINKRIANNNILKLEKEIERIKNTRQLQKKSRNNTNIFKVAIVGYTNAGKSTLLNLITKASIYADNLLFATLDTTSRNVFLEYGKSIVLTDTVGFISKLPHNLVDAFASTLEEAVDANLILHVMDVGNKHLESQREVVEKVLKDIGANAKIINVYNKSDIALNATFTDGIYISAKQNQGIDKLKQQIIDCMN